MSRYSQLLVAARQRVSAAVLLPLIGGNLLLLIAAMLALLIPDSHRWQLLLSGLLALGLVAGLLLWNATALRRLRTSGCTVPLWVGALLLAVWLLLAALLVHVVGLAEPNVETRAGYWNSQMSPGLRHLFPYTRLVSLQEWSIALVRCIFVPALLIPFAVETASFGVRLEALRRAFRVVMLPQHWPVAIVALGVVSWLVPGLANWHPLHTVAGETVSALLRLSCAVLLALLATITLLAADAGLLQRMEIKGPQERR